MSLPLRPSRRRTAPETPAVAERTRRGAARAVPRPAPGAPPPPGLAVDSYNGAPPSMHRFRALNPFDFDPEHRIPVPGRGETSCSVEAVWQGLKLVDGVPDLAMFDRPPHKRPPERERAATPSYSYRSAVFLYGERVLDLVTARHLIYLPAYLYKLDHGVPAELIAEIDGALARGVDVFFYDCDDNFDLADPTSSFSHSAILSAWFGRCLEERFLAPARARAEAAADPGLGPRLAACTARYRARFARDRS